MSAARGPLLLRLRVLWSQHSLDAMLIAGIDPASDPALTLRAGQLGSTRHRRRLAASVDALVRAADEARTGATAAVPVVREQVTEARDSLSLLADLLRRTEGVQPRGVAMVQRLLTDGGSALYSDTSRGAAELQVRAAIDWLIEERGSPPAPLHEAQLRRHPRAAPA
jgi:hypothetical protein